jgi:hypothetical protein
METEGSYKSPAVGYVLTASEGEQRSLLKDVVLTPYNDFV